MKLYVVSILTVIATIGLVDGKGLRSMTKKDLELESPFVTRRKLQICSPATMCTTDQDCPDPACSVCKKLGTLHLCQPGCGGECTMNSDCVGNPNSCTKCINGKCSMCEQGDIKFLKTGYFRKGPHCVYDGHKTGTYDVNKKCDPGYTRYDPRTTVTSTNIHKVACGNLNQAVHDVGPAYWKNANDESDCSLSIPYCEHYCGVPIIDPGHSTCTYNIYEKCTNPHGY